VSDTYARGKNAFGFCDVCGFRALLREMREVVVRMAPTNILACRSCWDPDHPQNMQGMVRVTDPQALRRPRPDTSLGPDGSRDIVWGWSPLLGLSADAAVGTVVVAT
jgi:hypothetical protein